MKRRAFLGFAAGIVLAHKLSARTGTRTLDRIGLQLYTVRSLMAASVPATLELVAKAGYKEVEFPEYFGARPAQLRRWLEDVGLTAPAAHVPLLDGSLDQVFAAAAELGHRYLIQGSLPLQQPTSLDDYRRAAGSLNRAGAEARNHDLLIAYHNHDFEFTPIEGIVPYDVLLGETDPALVSMEVDLYWMAKAGHDPVKYFGKHPGRFRLCHVKDIDADGNIVDVGRGQLDFQRILGHREKAGLRHFFVEHDNPPNPLNSIRTSYTYLRNL